MSSPTDASPNAAPAVARLESYQGQFALEEVMATTRPPLARRLEEATPAISTPASARVVEAPPPRQMEAPAPRQAQMETPLHSHSSNSHSSYLAPQPAAEGRQGPIEISYSNPLCLLDDVLTPSLVQSFRNQARCRPSLVTSEVITGTARIRIRLASTGDPTT